MRALTIPEMQITALKEVRERLNLPVDERGPEDLEVAAGVHGLSEIELNTFIDMAEVRYRAKRMDPGELPLIVTAVSEVSAECYQANRVPTYKHGKGIHIRSITTSWNSI